MEKLVEQLDLKVERHIVRDEDGKFVRGTALFYATGVLLKDAPVVSLARVPDHCYFPIDRLQEHNNHAPWGFGSEEALDDYVARVKAAVEAAAAEYQGPLFDRETGQLIENGQPAPSANDLDKLWGDSETTLKPEAEEEEEEEE